MSAAVVFRCNVSAQVGVGHLMRCREMAQVLRGLGIGSAILGPPDTGSPCRSAAHPSKTPRACSTCARSLEHAMR